MTILELGINYLLRIVGPCLITLATSLVGAVVYVFFTTVVYIIATPWTASYVVHSTIVLWFAGNILFNYYSCALTSPGVAPRESDLAALSEQTPLSEEARARKLNPPRSHHCFVLRRQVLRMDHFCPWVANCVGFFNYKFFYLFLFWMWSGCMYGICITIGPFWQCSRRGTFASRRADPMCMSRSQISFGFVITISVGIAVGLFLAFHTYLIITAQTTLEFHFNTFGPRRKKQNIYNLGARKNWHAVFGNGKYFFSWALPSWKPPPGDGFEYETISELTGQLRPESCNV